MKKRRVQKLDERETIVEDYITKGKGSLKYMLTVCRCFKILVKGTVLARRFWFAN